jgi:hypothetical protein
MKSALTNALTWGSTNAYTEDAPGNPTHDFCGIDQHHRNAYAEWLRMGSPVAPNEQQHAMVENVSALATLTDTPAEVAGASGTATLDSTLPRQGVSLIVLEWVE